MSPWLAPVKVSDVRETKLWRSWWALFVFLGLLTLEWGGEGAYNSLEGDTAFAINTIDQPLPDAHAHVDEKRGEMFAQGTWKISPEWLLEAGARFEYSRIAEKSENTKQRRTFFYPKPRAVLTWSPTKDDQVRVRYEKIVGQLDFGNFIATGNLGGNAHFAIPGLIWKLPRMLLDPQHPLSLAGRDGRKIPRPTPLCR